MNALLWNVEFWSITHCMICWYVVLLQNNNYTIEYFAKILDSIVIHPCKVQISC